MEKASSGKRINLGFWWHNSDGAKIMRFWIIFSPLLVTFLFLFFEKWYPYPEVLGLENFTAECLTVYTPPVVTNGELWNTNELLEVKCKTREEFAFRDKVASLHFYTVSPQSDGLCIRYTAKQAHNSTETYTFTEIIKDRPFNNYIYIHPESVFFENGKAFVKCEYKRNPGSYFVSAFCLLLIFIASLIISLKINNSLRERWVQKMAPE